MPLSFPEIEALKTDQPVLYEAMQKLISLVAPTQVTTSGRGVPNNVVRAAVNTIYVDTSDTSGNAQWIKTGKSGTNQGWVKLSTSANIVSGEVPTPAQPTSPDHQNYTVTHAPVPNTVQVYINGSRSTKPFTVSNRGLKFATPNASTDTVVLDYVKAIAQPRGAS